MKRGDLLIATLQGDYGKPRPVVIIQSNLFEARESVITCPISSHIVDTPLRLTLIPSERNGLRQASQIMIDKIITIKKSKIHQRIGHLSPHEITQLDLLLKRWLDLD